MEIVRGGPKFYTDTQTHTHTQTHTQTHTHTHRHTHTHTHTQTHTPAAYLMSFFFKEETRLKSVIKPNS